MRRRPPPPPTGHLRLLLVAALAGHRAGWAIAEDTISADARQKLHDWSIDWKATDRQVFWRTKLHQLVECPHCIGFWMCLIALAVYSTAQRRGWRLMSLAVEWWAVAGLQTQMAAWEQRNMAATEIDGFELEQMKKAAGEEDG